MCKRIGVLENRIFIPDEVRGSFYCSDCKNLKSLAGAPQAVGSFISNNCPRLKNQIRQRETDVNIF